MNLLAKNQIVKNILWSTVTLYSTSNYDPFYLLHLITKKQGVGVKYNCPDIQFN